MTGAGEFQEMQGVSGKRMWKAFQSGGVTQGVRDLGTLETRNTKI